VGLTPLARPELVASVAAFEEARVELKGVLATPPGSPAPRPPQARPSPRRARGVAERCERGVLSARGRRRRTPHASPASSRSRSRSPRRSRRRPRPRCAPYRGTSRRRCQRRPRRCARQRGSHRPVQHGLAPPPARPHRLIAARTPLRKVS
jgi:hypothetical protein